MKRCNTTSSGWPDGWSSYNKNVDAYGRCHDGTAVLTTAEDRVIRVYDRCAHRISSADDSPAQDDEMSFDQARLFSQPDAIHAATWYPSASASSLETFCFMTSIRDSPVRLVDAVDGRVGGPPPILALLTTRYERHTLLSTIGSDTYRHIVWLSTHPVQSMRSELSLLRSVLRLGYMAVMKTQLRCWISPIQVTIRLND